ncbi:MAG TPA: hypothetical protein VHB97_18530 [Polyangia bacterium]|nr:hypothetical protein [Polyangia bacterium]
MRRSAVLLTPGLLIGSALALAGVAHAQPGPVEPSLSPPAEEVVEARAVAWPLMFDMHALMGVEPHDRGNPIAFGAGAELLWRARVGGFAELISSEGTALIAPMLNGVQQPGFADRISIPFGLAARPLARWFVDRSSWAARLASGVGLQVGVTVEHLRTSDDNATTAGLHVALAVDVPIYGGPKQGGVSLRLYGRLMLTPAVSLDTQTVYEGPVSGQLFAGLVYYP